MFHALGQLVERHWKVLIAVWTVLLVVSIAAQAGALAPILPRFKDVVKDGEFAYLPRSSPTLLGEAVLIKGFPANLSSSSVVIIARREQGPLQEQDRKFVDDPEANPEDPKVVTIRNELEKIKNDESLWYEFQPKGKPLPVISRIRTYADEGVGKLLDSADGHATLVVVEFTSEFLEWRNEKTINAIDKLVNVRTGRLAQEGRIPPGLDLAVSGTAAVGRDMNVAMRESSKATELWTIALVVLLLLSIYRAPILALIPLITVFASRQVSLTVMTLLSFVPWLNVRIFMGLDVYMTVVLYGAGVDYCLFLIARYKEELDAGSGTVHGVGESLHRVGEAITASAATVIVGIGMMIFARFGKFQDAGVGIALSLVVTLIAALTFTPALMCLAGRKAFWPHGMTEHIPGPGKAGGGTTLIGRLIVRDRFQILWEQIGHWLVQKPGLILVVCIFLMLPFAAIGVMKHDHLSYGLLSELPRESQSVIGAQAVQEHYPPGYAAPITVLVQHDKYTFTNAGDEGREKILNPIIETLKADLEKKENGTLKIRDVRWVSEPLGQAQSSVPSNAFRKAAVLRAAKKHYVSSVEDFDGRLTRFELITDVDPFTPQSINNLNRIEAAATNAVPPDERAATKLHFIGATASIRDLKEVTDGDQIRIDVLVVVSVFLILAVLLRQIAVPFYLIISVFFSYLVSLGVTWVVFWSLDPANFAGLDWKVPVFVFTILIAVGEDYNIFLMTRIAEEQRDHGPVEGIRLALLKTGGIISSCGVIMAGTFCSLVLAGRLQGMQQLGFGLAFGVLLDTFVVRPILVPAYLLLLNKGHLGPLGHWLGATVHVPMLETDKDPDEKAA